MAQEVLMASHRHLRAQLARHHGPAARSAVASRNLGGYRLARTNGKEKRDIKDATDEASMASYYAGLADAQLSQYEGCLKIKHEVKGKKRGDLYPCKKLPPRVYNGFMNKKGKGKCDSHSVFVENCRNDYNRWQKYLGLANDYAKEASKKVADLEGIPLTAASQIVDEIMYEADPKAFQSMQQSMYDDYVEKTGLEPPSPKDYQEAFTPDTSGEESTEGSIMPILLGVAGLGALGFLGYSLFSE